MNSNLIDLFKKTRTSNNVDEIYDLLLQLSPNNLSDREILHIVKWIEVNSQKLTFTEPHYNIFGTGGDSTINISSMASIIASKFIKIIKIGTSAVTSRYGSSDFFSNLEKYRNIKASIHAKEKMMFYNDSNYIPLSNLGFQYSPKLKEARRKLRANNQLDIYKIVFPIANYTNPVGQINGVCREEYLERYKTLSKKLNISSYIVYSEYGMDELLPGHNKIVRVYNGQLQETRLYIPQISERPDRLVSEKLTISECLSVFEEIILGKAHIDLIKTIIYNAAIIIKLSGTDLDIHEISSHIEKYLKNDITQSRELE